MIDKQINTCEFLSICQTDCNGTLEDTEVCHCFELYKQLKRKEQENEMWKNQVLTTDDEAITVQVTQQQFEEYNKAKQALTEIKEIVEWHTTNTDSEDVQEDMNSILQIISEVEL